MEGGGGGGGVALHVCLIQQKRTKKIDFSINQFKINSI